MVMWVAYSGKKKIVPKMTVSSTQVTGNKKEKKSRSIFLAEFFSSPKKRSLSSIYKFLCISFYV